MMIKSWYKYNESTQDLTEEMILNIIYFINSAIHSNSEAINRDVDSIINVYLDEMKKVAGQLDFDLDSMIFTNEEEYKKVQEYIRQIYEISLKDSKLKDILLSIFERVKKLMGKVLFTDYEDLFLEFMEDGFNLEFVFKPGEFMKIEIKKVISVEEHTSCLQRCVSTIKRLLKVFSLPEDIAYISNSTFESEGPGGHSESHIEITVL
jgi:hypothetical protein